MGSSTNDDDREIELAYMQIFEARGFDTVRALDAARQMIAEAKAGAERAGTANLPPDYGDRLVAHEATEPAIRERFAASRRDGVRDEDIRMWWNMPDFHRRMAMADDAQTHMMVFAHHIQAGRSRAEAAARLRQFHPMYGNPEDTSHTTGDDRPLPYELKDRVNRYIERRMQGDVEAYQRDIEQSSTFNALVRREVRAGHL